MTEPEVEALERWARYEPIGGLDRQVLALCAAWRAQQDEIARLTEQAEIARVQLDRWLSRWECRQQQSVP